jgi:hypothetical protein
MSLRSRSISSRLALLAASLVLAVPLAACGGGGGGGGSASTTGFLHGKVTNAKTGLPVAATP